MNKGLLLVISGPSGSGKGTVLKELFKINKNLAYSVSATTRNARPGEVEGRDYFFLSLNEFESMIEKDGLLEYANYCGNYYGTPRKAVEERRAAGMDVILEIDVQGALKIREKCPDAVMIFIMPPSLKVLAKRLRGRGTEDEEKVNKRLATAKNEIMSADKYDYIVVNDALEDAVNSVGSIIKAEKQKSSCNTYLITEVLENA